MASFKCPECGYIYNETKGDPHEGFPAGTTWSNLPEGWTCPDCAIREKIDFVPVSKAN